VNARVFTLFVVLAGCNASVKVDPEGYRCNVGNTCPTGYACRDGFCRASTTIDPSCEGVTCSAPPAASCTSATVLRTFAGRCVTGQCQYDPVDSTCPTSCLDGACVDPCLGISCVTPPAPACTDANTLRTFSQTGSCTTGSCDYQSTDTTCANGCDMGRCKGVDLCVNVTCNMPPAAACVTGARRTFANPGTCDPGTGMCTYASSDQACPNGCALGQCLTQSVTFAQTGPRVRFAINGLDVAPGSSGNTALAVGNGGRIARWDGSMWTEIPSGTTNTLHKVAFVTGSIAYAVGASRTALVVRPGSTTMPATPVNLSGTSNSNLVAVSGRSEGEVLIASDNGGWWRMRGSTWENGTLPSANAPWNVTGAFLDESLRERIVGGCNSSPAQCVAYRNASAGTPNYVTHQQTGTRPLTAVGGSFDVASAGSSEAFLGSPDNSLDSHTNLGNFSGVTPTPALEGAGIVGITAQAVSIGRDVFVLTSSKDPTANTSGQGHLYRLSRGINVSSTDVLSTYFGEDELSPNDANGVLVAEIRRAENVNNVFRRGIITNEALDVGEDFVGASLDDNGALVLVSGYGDVIVRRPTVSTFDFRRPPTDWSIEGFTARNGTGIVMVGEDATGTNGVIVRVTQTGFNTQATRAGVTFKAVCRVSDTEGWAVGTGGVIFRVTAGSATSVTSPTTKDLLAVDCAAGQGIAAGADGTVLRLVNGTWTAVTPAFPVMRPITQAKLTPGGGFVSGTDFFSGFVASTGTWVMLPPKQGLTSLVVRGPQEVYGAVVTNGSTELFRFDGASWGTRLLQVSGVLGGGGQGGSRVVWGGTLGCIVEGGP
jgi:hypothetical protein